MLVRCLGLIMIAAYEVLNVITKHLAKNEYRLFQLSTFLTIVIANSILNHLISSLSLSYRLYLKEFPEFLTGVGEILGGLARNYIPSSRERLDFF